MKSTTSKAKTYYSTLSELKVATKNRSIPDLVKKGIVDREGNGFTPGDDDTFYVMFTFVDIGEDQNVFQGDALKLN
ncbi:TasA family protein [Bacillus thuringiensis]|uniref:TasA family protein n=1 Tax=Bacillus thuringiensis TaxID=1428 RepID=UPI003B8A6819